VAVNDGGWESGDEPWIRRELTGDAFGARGYAQCYFCGEHTAKLSGTDLRSDSGRVEVYCDNGDCDAREVTVIVTRDGNRADMRADVRILRALDDNSHSSELPSLKAVSWRQLLDSGDDQEVIARRIAREPITYPVPGPFGSSAQL